MRRRVLGAGLLAAIVFALPGAESFGQNKKKGDADKPKAQTVDSAKLPAREYAGKLSSVPGTDRVFTMEVESKSIVPAGGNRRTGINLKATTTWTGVEFQASEKARVRTMVLPEQFDDKGNLKKYTSKQLAELRGKDSQGLPGYESSLDKLEAGQKVSVQLAVAPARAAAKGKDKDDAAVAEKKMQVKLIVIHADANSGERATPKGKKK